jgi:DNA repair exonuclease SbcCD ATPase subunit
MKADELEKLRLESEALTREFDELVAQLAQRKALIAQGKPIPSELLDLETRWADHLKKTAENQKQWEATTHGMVRFS